MHFEILIEDKSGEVLLEGILPQIIVYPHSFRIHSYKGVGHIPKNMNHASDPAKRILLERLPKLLSGYGKTPGFLPSDNQYAVIFICDLDDKCRHDFRLELIQILNNCNPKPNVVFCIAVEEGEAWLLGDIPAIQRAYPNAKARVLYNYVNDSICNTWECLADAVYRGGAKALASRGYQAIGLEKSRWAQHICPYMDISNNKSPSFNYLKNKLKGLMGN